MSINKPKVLVITPALHGGSWIAINELMSESRDDVQFMVLGYGNNQSESYAKFIIFPFPSYDKYGILINSNPIFSLLYSVPLVAMGVLLTMVYRPNVIVANGILSSLPGIILKPFLKIKIIISYHGEIKHYTRGNIRKLVRYIVGNNVDLIQVNSEGSRADASLIAESSKITVIEHWVNKVFFEPVDRESVRNKLAIDNKFLVLFIGRLDKEKFCNVLLDAAKELESDGIVFYFIGRGEMANKIEKLASEDNNIFYHPYLKERTKLKEYYIAADLVWGYADETYLARPTIESLACGTPIIVPNIPAVLKKAEQGIRIPRDLVSEEIGWMVSPDDVSSIVNTIRSVKSGNLAHQDMRKKCAKYAIKHHGDANLIKKKYQLVALSKSFVDEKARD